MPRSKYLIAILLSVSLTLPIQATTDCETSPDPFCSLANGIVDDIEGATKTGVAVAIVAIGVGIYFLVDSDADDPDYQARLLNDYARGNGIRLTDYDQPLNVSLLPHQKRFQVDTYQSKFQQQLDYNPVKLQLINISYEW